MSKLVGYLSDKNFLYSTAVLAVSACLYAYGILAAPRTFHSLITIAFLIALACVFAINFVKTVNYGAGGRPGVLTHLLLYALTLHLALILGFYLSGRPEIALWVKDSYDLHIPGAVNIMNFMQGKEALSSIGVPLGGVSYAVSHRHNVPLLRR